MRIVEEVDVAINGDETRRIGMSQHQASGFRGSSSAKSRDRRGGAGLAVA